MGYETTFKDENSYAGPVMQEILYAFGNRFSTSPFRILKMILKRAKTIAAKE